jgi:hypothetical protein
MGTNINTIKRLSRKFQGIYILSPYNPDYLLVKNAIESTGVTLTSTQNNAGNTLVNQLQSYNIWGKQKTLYGILGGTAAAHKWNWINPLDTNVAYRLTFSTGWTHSSTGMIPNGTSAYADTFISPNTAFTNYSGSLSYYSRTNNTNSGIDVGSLSVTGNYFMQLYSSGLLGSRASLQRNDSNYVLFSSTNRSGLFTGSITANNSMKIYQNGVLKNTNTTTDTTALNSVKLSIGALNNNGTIQSYANRECAFFAASSGLTDTEAANFYTAVQNYQTTLNRQV